MALGELALTFGLAVRPADEIVGSDVTVRALGPFWTSAPMEEENRA